MSSLGDKIKLNRTKMNLTQEELGKQLHVSRQTISNWEVSRSYPDIESLILLSDIFDISLDKLLREDVKMISSLKKRSVMEIMYILIIVSLIVGGLITVIIDFIINRSLTWSVIVSASCLLPGAFLTVFKYTKRFHLLKSSIVTLGTIFILFLAIDFNVEGLDFKTMIEIGALWYLFYLFIVYLIEFSRLDFWNMMIMTLLISFLLNTMTRLLTGENIFGFVSIVSNLSNICILIICIFTKKMNLDKNIMNLLLARYREYTQFIK